MRDVVVDEIIYIDEECYQKLKKELGKEDDYYNMKEIKKYSLNWGYFLLKIKIYSVIISVVVLEVIP